MSVIKPLVGIMVVLLFSAGIAWAGSQGSIEFAGLPLFFICACIGFLLHWVVFVPSFLFQTEHYFDLTGALSYLATLGFAYAAHPEMQARGILLSLMIALWAARLGSFLFLRVKQAGQDRRFNLIKTRFFRFLFTWTLGGAWVFITMAAALAAFTTATDRGIDSFFVIGTLLWITGFTLEVVADLQKSRFRADPANKDKFITSGLWSRSRHPNYFGEILLWFGIAVIAIPVLAGWQLLTLISPVFVAMLLTRISGVNLLEASGKERWGSDPAYQHYVANTPALIPRIA